MTQTINTTQENPEWVLMAKALRGELSAQEQLDFIKWLHADETHSLVWSDALVAWDQVGQIQHLGFEPDADAAWEKVCVKTDFKPSFRTLEPDTDQPIASPLVTEAAVRQMIPWNQLMRYAAALLLAAGLGWTGYFLSNQSPEFTQIATLSGERRMFYLPDSSQVTLNGNSVLKYQTAFNGEIRSVELEGEGFFEVRKNPERPFVVISGDAKTQVLGTSFLVQAHPESKAVSVVVYTGKVSLASVSHKKEIILTPGLTGTLSNTGLLEKNTTEQLSKIAWRTLSFQGSTLKEVAAELEAYFGITMVLKSSSLADCTFTGSFEDPALQDILSVLAVSNDIKISQGEKDSYAIEGPGCK